MESALPREGVVTYPAETRSSPTNTSTETSPSPSAPRAQPHDADSDNSLGPVLALPIGTNREGSSPSGRENAIGSSGSIGAQAHTSSAATSRDEDGVGGLSPQHDHTVGGVQSLNTRANSSSESANNNSNGQRASMPSAGVEGLPASRGDRAGLFEEMLAVELQFPPAHHTSGSHQHEALHLQLPSSVVPPVARGDAHTQDTALYAHTRGDSTSGGHSSHTQSIDKPSSNSVYTTATGGEKSSTETTEGFALSLSPSSAAAMVGCFVMGGPINDSGTDGAHRLQDRQFYNSSNATVAAMPPELTCSSFYNMVSGHTTSAVIGLSMSTHVHPSPFGGAGENHSAQTSTNTLAQPSPPSSNSYPSAKAPCAGGSSVAVSHGAGSSGTNSQQSQHNNSSESNATHTTNTSNNIITERNYGGGKVALSSSIAEIKGESSSLSKASLRTLANDAPFRYLQVEDKKENQASPLISHYPPMPSLFGAKVQDTETSKGNTSHKINYPSNADATNLKVGTPHSSRPREGSHVEVNPPHTSLHISSHQPDFRGLVRNEKNEKELSAASHGHSHEPLLSCEDAFAANGTSHHPIVCAPGEVVESANGYGSSVTTGARTTHYDCDSYRFSEAVSRNQSSGENLSFAGKTKAKLLTASLDSFLRSSVVPIAVQDPPSHIDTHPLRIAQTRQFVPAQHVNTFNEGELYAQVGLIEAHQRRSLSTATPESSTGPLPFRGPGSRLREPSSTLTPTDADGDMQVSTRSQSGHLVRRQAKSQAGDREEARGVLGGGAHSNESSLSLVDQPTRLNSAHDESSREYQGLTSERASTAAGNINTYNKTANGPTYYTYAKHTAYRPSSHPSSATPQYSTSTHTNKLSSTPAQPRGYHTEANPSNAVDQQTANKNSLPQLSQLGGPNANGPAYYPHATRRALLQQQQQLPPLTGSQPQTTVSSCPEGSQYAHNNNIGRLYRNTSNTTSFQQSSTGSFNNSHTSFSANLNLCLDDAGSNLNVNYFTPAQLPAGPQLTQHTTTQSNGSTAHSYGSNTNVSYPDLSCRNPAVDPDLAGHALSGRGASVGGGNRRPSGGTGQVTSSANNSSTLGIGMGGGSLNSGNGPWLVASAPNSPQSHLGSGGWSTATPKSVGGSASLTHNNQMNNITTTVNINSSTNINIATLGPGTGTGGSSSTGNITSSNVSIAPALNAPHFYGQPHPSSSNLQHQGHAHTHTHRLFIPPPPPHPTTYNTFLSYGTEPAEANMIAAGMMRRWFAKTCAFMDIARQQHSTQICQFALTTQGSGSNLGNQSLHSGHLHSAAQQTASELKAPSAALDAPRTGDGCSTTDTFVKGTCNTPYSSPASSAIASPTNEPASSGGNHYVGVMSSNSSVGSKPGAGPTSLSTTQQFPHGQDGHSQIPRANGQHLPLTTVTNPSPSLGSSNSSPASPIAPSCVIVGLSGINVATNPPDPSRYAEFALWCSDACTWWDKAFTNRTSFCLIGPNATLNMGPTPVGPGSSVGTPIPVPSPNVVVGDRPMSVSIGFRSGLAPPPPHSTSVIGGLGGSTASSNNRLLGSTSTHGPAYGPSNSGIFPAGVRVINVDTGVGGSGRMPPSFPEPVEERDRVARGNSGRQQFYGGHSTSSFGSVAGAFQPAGGHSHGHGHTRADDQKEGSVGAGRVGSAGVGPTNGGICSSGIAPDAQGGLDERPAFLPSHTAQHALSSVSFPPQSSFNPSYMYPHQYQYLQQQLENVNVARTQATHSGGRNFPLTQHVPVGEHQSLPLVSVPSPVWHGREGPPTGLPLEPLTLGSANDSVAPINPSLDAVAAGTDIEEKRKKKTRRGKRSLEAIQRQQDRLASARAAHASSTALPKKYTETNSSTYDGHPSRGSD